MTRPKRPKATSEEERIARRRAHDKAWRERNPEKVKARMAAYYAANKERSREYGRKRRAENGDRERTRARDWARNWRANNLEKYRARNRANSGLPEPTRPRPGTCDCCGGPPKGQGTFHVDHCHDTGAFRGWLCSKCNLGIGSLGDNLEGLKRAVAYLEKHGTDWLATPKNPSPDAQPRGSAALSS